MAGLGAPFPAWLPWAFADMFGLDFCGSNAIAPDNAQDFVLSRPIRRGLLPTAHLIQLTVIGRTFDAPSPA